MTKKDLLDILEDLGDDEFENFKWHLNDEKVGDIPPIKEIKLSKAKMRDVVDLMVQKYTFPGAVDVFKSILKKISRNDLVGKLPNISSGAEDQERVLQRKFHTISLPPGELHLTWSRTNLPQNPKPTDQPSTSHSQSLRNPVALDVGSDLVLSSLSSAALDEAEAAVLRELSEVTVQLQGATAVSPDLDRVKEILIKAKNEANLQELRVDVSFIPVPRQAAVTKVLVRYSENVNKLKEVLQDYQMNQIERLQNEVQIHISDKIRQAGGAGEKLLYHKTTQDSCDSSMTTGFNRRFAGQNRRKISIVVLGTEDYLKKSLISVILGKDVSVYRNTLNKTEMYENDTYEVIYTPNLYEASEEIKKIFSSKHPDMSVLVLKDEISTQEVQQQIENLHKTIEKQTEEFRVVLPLNHKVKECYPDNCWTMEELFSRLRELAEDKHLRPTHKR
ncbi:uncharacterized protein LOC121888536 [Thunnus maccoyii]|uniref:uncharacterized protein LOC121888536 n=1 Tax=Thunnus maccoyii TaxID=8240 RepID=UPI001C4DB8C5|nr:uncharacterized protein LOC121888536 [Thunnus maccoyii]